MGETKIKILMACTSRKSWTDLKTTTDRSDPTLMTHLDDLRRDGYLEKSGGLYSTTKKGLDFMVSALQAISVFEGMGPIILKQIYDRIESIDNHNKMHCKQCRNRGY